MAASNSLSLKEYLKKYEKTSEVEKKEKKKKSKKTKKKDHAGILVVDEDPLWQKPVIVEEENEEDSADEEKPQVDEDIEVKRMKRLKHIRSVRPYNEISEDGSGWISVSDTQKNSSLYKRSPDVAPSREQRSRYDTPSPEAEINPTSSDNKDPDLSPPRRRRMRIQTPSPELNPKNSETKEPDLSPPRQRRRHFHTPSPEPELNPTGSGKTNPALSPARHPRRHFHTPSPEPKPSNLFSANHDLSPPRRRIHSQTSEFKRKNSEGLDSTDCSPPRRLSRRSAEVDASLDSHGTDLSPPRKSRKDHGQSESLDLSPPRRTRHKSVGAPDESHVSEQSPPRKKKAGFLTAQEIKKEIERDRKEEMSRFKKMDPSVSGRAPERIYRDKDGKRISKDEVLKSQKGEEKPKEVKLEWGKGLVQKREAEAKMLELEAEKEKPFARTRDDPELDNMLKEKIRWGDPMAHLVKRKQPEIVLGNLGDNDKMKESGFMIPQDIPSHSWIKRKIDATPNRYGIRPGRHWDGVNRSNGFEEQFFKRMNEKQATEKEAYLWSVSDM